MCLRTCAHVIFVFPTIPWSGPETSYAFKGWSSSLEARSLCNRQNWELTLIQSDWEGTINSQSNFRQYRENIIRPYSRPRVSELRQERPNLNTTAAKYHRPSTLSVNHGLRLWRHRFEPPSDYRALRSAAFLQALWTTSI